MIYKFYYATDNVTSIEDNPGVLISLKESDTMQNSGEVFNPDYYLIDSRTRIVYRKEQFDNNDELPAEYIIRDKRYTMNEIVGMLENTGFAVEHKQYTNAGFSKSLGSTEPNAKEILIVARK